MPKFTMEEHERRMREILSPQPKVEGGGLLGRLLAMSRERGMMPPIKKASSRQEIW